MDKSTEEKRPQTKSGIGLKLKRCGKEKEINEMPNTRKALANLSANMIKKEASAGDKSTQLSADERILDAAIDATVMGQIPPCKASELAALAISQLTPDRMQAFLVASEREKARFD